MTTLTYVYEGDLRDGKIEGRGKLTYADGGVYEGDYIGDKIEGNGVLKDRRGSTKRQGVWRNGYGPKKEDDGCAQI